MKKMFNEWLKEYFPTLVKNNDLRKFMFDAYKAGRGHGHSAGIEHALNGMFTPKTRRKP